MVPVTTSTAVPATTTTTTTVVVVWDCETFPLVCEVQEKEAAYLTRVDLDGAPEWVLAAGWARCDLGEPDPDSEVQSDWFTALGILLIDSDDYGPAQWSDLQRVEARLAIEAAALEVLCL